ncbi:MAG: alpha/beta fold hydrolase [Bacteroidota bacterium]
MKIENFEVITKDGFLLHGKKWLTESVPKAIICFQHGLAEHSDRYNHVADFFVQNDIALYSVDLRGHGKSEGKRGHTPSFNLLMNDCERMLMEARKDHFSEPLILYGHSTGGNVVANFLCRKNTLEVSGAILSAPWLKLAFEPPAFKVKLAKFASRIFPSFSQDNELDPTHLSKDESVVKAYVGDPLVHRKISAKMFFECYNAGIYALDHAEKVSKPTLVMHGDDDKITSNSASKDFASANTDHVEFKNWSGLRHEIHNEPEQAEVMDFALKFIQEKILK